ncbi:hypothetical protein PK35_13310 [Tamlana nanhaiensis]|uniref:Uncharacterized protein n=1 Tax=Neotamlana nanhaiensis TaxID=1382798 RepID=A0A0D7W1J8_9FLAO|nr:hypothetical protein [Tamlana nanhaiensis]KJD31727.1 hypothetical protein PK35_13310 [Tamlana nanhaiensis]
MKLIALDTMRFKLLVLVFCINYYCFCQTKNEKETRIKAEAFTCINKLKWLPNNIKRLRFYKETDGDKHSFEAKFKYSKNFYSLEFNDDCVLEDIEVLVKQKAIAPQVWTEIMAYFKQNYQKTHVIKIQRQFVNNNTTHFINEVLQNAKTLVCNYEIIAEVKTKTAQYIYELTFNPKGMFISSRVLTPNSYEFALY